VKLILSKTFTRDAKRFLKRNPQLAVNIKEALSLLENDIYHPYLRTHKLKGSLKNCWSCSVGYDIRIIFELVQEENENAILLLTIGTHDEVY
jgi:addiction module RelE/StbE family toxin